MLRCGKVSQENFAVLTATFAIPIEFQTMLEVRQRNRYNYFKENRYNQPMDPVSSENLKTVCTVLSDAYADTLEKVPEIYTMAYVCETHI